MSFDLTALARLPARTLPRRDTISARPQGSFRISLHHPRTVGYAGKCAPVCPQVVPTPHGAWPTHGKNFFDILVKVGDFVDFVPCSGDRFILSHMQPTKLDSAGRLQMQQPNSKWMKRARAAAAVVTAAMGLFLIQPLRAEVIEKTKKVGDTTVHYKVVLPNNYDPAKAYPAVLVMGGGPQNMNTVDNILARNFRAEAEKRGYIIVGPAAPDDDLFFDDGDRIFPEFLKMILADYKIQDNKFHVAGPSNGGIASLHVAATNPDYFLSVTAFPGYMWEPDEEKLQAISKMCVFMYVGEHDPYRWHGEMKREAEFLRSKGTVARYTVEQGQPHRLETLAGENAGRLFDGFEETKKGCSK
jgi:predicted esterase